MLFSFLEERCSDNVMLGPIDNFQDDSDRSIANKLYLKVAKVNASREMNKRVYLILERIAFRGQSLTIAFRLALSCHKKDIAILLTCISVPKDGMNLNSILPDTKMKSPSASKLMISCTLYQTE